MPHSDPPYRRLFRLRFLRRSLDREVEDELESHIALRVEQLAGRGMSSEEARVEAIRRLGGLEEARRRLRESARARDSALRRASAWDAVARDVTHALRRARHAPGYTALVVLSLALGIGLTTAVFTVVDGVLVRPLPLTHPDELVALVPVSIRRPDESGELGNRIATILVRLPIGAHQFDERLELVRAETARLKASDQARATSLIIQATGWTPPTINRLISGAMARPRVFNLVVSNVPGPQMPFYLLGRRLLEVYPFVPLSPQGHALSIGVVSYDGGVFFGLAGDRRAIADIDALAGAVWAELDALASRS